LLSFLGHPLPTSCSAFSLLRLHSVIFFLVFVTIISSRIVIAPVFSNWGGPISSPAAVSNISCLSQWECHFLFPLIRPVFFWLWSSLIPCPVTLGSTLFTTYL
jgi:hypothetical protein